MGKKDKRVDAYIEKALPFAREVMNKFRTLVHKAVPEVEETIKWNFPNYEYKGPLCHMAAFKNHCAVGFYKAELMKDPEQIFYDGEGKGMSSLGKILSIDDLPEDKVLLAYIREAAQLNEKGIKKTRPKTEKPLPEMPVELKASLKDNPKAENTYNNFSPSAKREYLEWITEAKTEATRLKRISQAVEWMAEGKKRNWKYEKKS